MPGAGRRDHRGGSPPAQRQDKDGAGWGPWSRTRGEGPGQGAEDQEAPPPKILPPRPPSANRVLIVDFFLEFLHA